MPFGDGTFDRVIAAEVLEHISDDQRAMDELARVLRPGGLAAITVPSFLPERVCWALSTEYHEVPGGHVRIYTRVELQAKLARAGLTALWHHHAHGLHSPYWWLKCAVGVHDDKHRLAAAYHRLLVWDLMRKPAVTRLTNRRPRTSSALTPIHGLLAPAGRPAAIRSAMIGGSRSIGTNMLPGTPSLLPEVSPTISEPTPTSLPSRLISAAPLQVGCGGAVNSASSSRYSQLPANSRLATT